MVKNSGQKMNIAEAFHSLQGEGFFVGRPSTFIRIAGCNQACVWCDTPIEVDEDITEDTILRLFHQHPDSDIVITGGEPTADLDTLGAVLHLIDSSFSSLPSITIETNGTKSVDVGELEENIFWSISPKLTSSGEDWKKCDFQSYFIKQHSQFKFVIDVENQQDYEDLKTILLFMPAYIPVILQPVAHKGASLEEYSACVDALFTWVADEKFKQNIRVIPQIHKYIWGLDTQGV